MSINEYQGKHSLPIKDGDELTITSGRIKQLIKKGENPWAS
jgi:hypothetical protein